MIFILLPTILLIFIFIIIIKIAYNNGFDHGYNEASFNKDAEYKKRFNLKDFDLFEDRIMIINEYGASCTICQKEFGSHYTDRAKIKYRTTSKEDLINHLERNNWQYLKLLDYVICPECQKRFELLETRVKWDGVEMPISQFIIKDLK